MRYTHDPSFSLDDWADAVSDKKRKRAPKVPDSAIEILLREKAMRPSELYHALKDITGACLKTAERAVHAYVSDGNAYHVKGIIGLNKTTESR
jgi:hypothetical protein